VSGELFVMAFGAAWFVVGEQRTIGRPADTAEIPMLIRRRLRGAALAAVACALEPLRAASRPVGVVFCSRHGDLQRTQRLLVAMAEGRAPAPLEFSLSVHNALAGMLDAPTIEAMCRRYDVPAANRLQAPSVFIGDVYLSPDEINLTRLTALIEEMSVAGSAQPWAELDDAALGTATQNITERFAGWGVLAIVGAGLLDGVNPCAFATIIFFISYLAISGRTGNQIIMVGSTFTFAVFLTYTALGLGLSTLVEELGGSSVVGRVIYGATALVCVLFAGLSLWDYRKIRQGKLTEIALQLPKSLKKRIHATIRKRTRVKGFIGAAFIAGMLVSLFELACTGQVYLPTIVFMTSVTEWRTTAIAYLILYNLMFVIPLIAVFAVAYYGASSDNLTAYFQTHVGAVKLLTAALFGALALWLMYILQIG
jgi:cytochrome c biogenesis protein CcdA